MGADAVGGADAADEVAGILSRTGCARFSMDEPFTYASGLRGPVYCDNRRLLGFPAERARVIGLLARLADREGGFDAVGGVATGGIPWASALAHEKGLPLLYVRAKRKAHGAKGRVEGFRRKGARVLLVEDLVNQGGSLEAAVLALRAEGLETPRALALVDYGMEAARGRFHRLGIAVSALTSFPALVRASGLGARDAGRALAWRKRPEDWP